MLYKYRKHYFYFFFNWEDILTRKKRGQVLIEIKHFQGLGHFDIGISITIIRQRSIKQI